MSSESLLVTRTNREKSGTKESLKPAGHASPSSPLMGLFPFRVLRTNLPMGIVFTVAIWVVIFYLALPHKSALNTEDSYNLVSDLAIMDDLNSKRSNPKFHINALETLYTEGRRKIKRFQIVDMANGQKPLTYAEFLNNLQTNIEFVDDFSDVLRRGLQSFSDMDMNPYFFETPPVTRETVKTTEFEFVLIAAPAFLKASPDEGAFEKYFKNCKNDIAAFPNLGGDAQLVVPCRTRSSNQPVDRYTHLANFMRMGEDKQIRAFWQESATQMKRRLDFVGGKKVWLSTCGLGIFWLHLRLDSRPKYYSYSKYREM